MYKLARSLHQPGGLYIRKYHVAQHKILQISNDGIIAINYCTLHSTLSLTTRFYSSSLMHDAARKCVKTKLGKYAFQWRRSFSHFHITSMSIHRRHYRHHSSTSWSLCLRCPGSDQILGFPTSCHISNRLICK